MQHRYPPRQGLAHPAHQREVLRAGQQPAAGLPMGVDVVLDVVEELRRVLDLVEDDALAGVGQEADRIVACDVSHVRALERHVAVRVAELLAEQGRLAGLAGPGDEHGGEGTHRSPEGGRQCTWDVRHRFAHRWRIKSNAAYYICKNRGARTRVPGSRDAASEGRGG